MCWKGSTGVSGYIHFTDNKNLDFTHTEEYYYIQKLCLEIKKAMPDTIKSITIKNNDIVINN